MKEFARWLFMRTHEEELKSLASQVRDKSKQAESPSWVVGVLDAMEALDLLVGE